MKLHRGQLEKLSALVNGLNYSPGQLIEQSDDEAMASFADQILEAQPWKKFLEYQDLFGIVWRSVYTAARDIPLNYHGPFSGANEGGAAEHLVRLIREDLESIPCTVDIFIPLSGLPELHQSEIHLSPNMALVDASHSQELRNVIERVSPTNTLVAALRGLEALPAHLTTIRFLRIRDVGFADDDPNSRALLSALSAAKRLAFIGLGSGALSLHHGRHKWDRRGIADRIPALVVRRFESGEQVYGTTIAFDLAHFLHRLHFTNPLEVLDFGNGAGLLSAKSRPATSGADVQAAIASILRIAIQFMAIDSLDAAPVRAAMEWYIDAQASHNESIAFLQRCIGLEALLGADSGRRDVTEKLADRYAYLLGKTESVRANMRKTFKDMYAHRSAIVHGRASQLSKEHKLASAMADDMLLHSAWAEMNNLLSIKSSR